MFMNAIEALLKAYQPYKPWDKIKTDPLYSEYISICQNLHYSMGTHHAAIEELSSNRIIN